MKTTITKVFTLLFLTIVSTSCMIEGFNTVNGNRNVTTEKRNITEKFNRIKVGQGIQVYITQDSKTSIVLKADENLHRLIKTEVKNGVLKISSKKNIRKAKSKKVYVSNSIINGIEATSGSDVYTEGVISTDTFEAHVSSGADAKIHINASTVNSSSSSGAGLRIKGKSNYHNTKASSGSSIKAYELQSKTVTAKASSGAAIDVYASVSLNASASSGGDIDFKGEPKNVDKKKSSGGSVSSY